MESITDQWNDLPSLEKILWAIALIASLLFVIQTLMTFAMGDGELDGDADADIAGDEGAGHQMFTLKNLVAFFTLFGWTGLGCLQAGMQPLLALVLASVAGVAMVALMMFLLARITQLKHSGTLDLKNAIGLTGRVYLTIPAARAGIGKVHLRVQGGVKELDALTDLAAPIATGAMVRVVAVIDERILLVSTHSDT